MSASIPITVHQNEDHIVVATAHVGTAVYRVIGPSTGMRSDPERRDPEGWLKCTLYWLGVGDNPSTSASIPYGLYLLISRKPSSGI